MFEGYKNTKKTSGVKKNGKTSQKRYWVSKKGRKCKKNGLNNNLHRQLIGNM
jgi:hypothetical protein